MPQVCNNFKLIIKIAPGVQHFQIQFEKCHTIFLGPLAKAIPAHRHICTPSVGASGDSISSILNSKSLIKQWDGLQSGIIQVESLQNSGFPDPYFTQNPYGHLSMEEACKAVFQKISHFNVNR